MLYVTTRSKADSYTSHRALHESFTPDGGLFVPMQLPFYDQGQLQQLNNQSFFEIVATILNQFFSVRISAWDVKACLGRNPVTFVAAGHKITVAEIYHTLDSTYDQIASRLYGKLTDTEELCSEIPDWAAVVIRIAVLFATFSHLDGISTQVRDVVVPTDDFTLPMAVWYAREMGLPIGTILLCCCENAIEWDFMQRGTFSVTRQNPALPKGMERLIWCTLGRDEVQRYLQICQRGGVYQLDFQQLLQLNRGVKAVVSSSKRTGKLIASILSSHSVVLDSQTAMAYGCLQDYRATTGISHETVLLADRSPKFDIGSILKESGISREKLISLISHS